ncbi:MAG: sulfatase [Armatimonadota bacterium]
MFHRRRRGHGTDDRGGQREHPGWIGTAAISVHAGGRSANCDNQPDLSVLYPLGSIRRRWAEASFCDVATYREMEMMARPNVLWICTDQQRFDTVGGLNNPHISTPNFDRLMDTGVAFSHAYSQSPVCTPSRYAFLTGRYPRTARGRQNGQAVPIPDEPYITKLLADDGWDCGLSGKLHLAVCQDTVEPRTDDGYSTFHWSHHPSPDWEENEYSQWLKREGLQWEELHPFRPGVDGYYGEGCPAEYHQTKWCADRAIDHLKDSDGPWLVSVNVFDPHHAFDPPPEYLERWNIEEIPLPKYRPGELQDKPEFQRIDHQGGYGGRGLSAADATDEDLRGVRAAYWAMIENIDHNLGRMLDALEETGQRENTIVIFQSDHGEMLGDHGILLKGPYFYEEAIRVPLIISWPGHFQEGLVSDALVELVDIAPTLVEITGVKPNKGMQGRSLVPILQGEADPHTHKDDIYCEYYNAMPFHDPPPYGTMYRDGRYKICVFHGTHRGQGELYDLQEDPDEFENLWDEPTCAGLKQDLIARCFDRSVFTMDPWPERAGRY